MKYKTLTLATLFMAAHHIAHALDFRSTVATWTFDTVSQLQSGNVVQNLGGIYYTGGDGSTLFTYSDVQSGRFSDGTTWKTQKSLKLTPNSFKETLLNGKRRIAGGSFNSSFSKCLAFNVSVPGTFYMVVRGLSASNAGTVNVCFQYKGDNAVWEPSLQTKTLSAKMSEMTMRAHQPGTFWISASKGAYVYAMRFVPSGEDSLPLLRTVQHAVSLTELPDGNCFADFGRDAFAQPELTLTSETGQDSVVVHLGECVSGGRINRAPGGSRRYSRYVVHLAKGTHDYHITISDDSRNVGSSAVHMPMEVGEVTPFRYCEVENYKETLTSSQLRRVVVNYPFDDNASNFRCDNEMLNRIWDFCKYSVKATTYTGYYIDGDRERIPYEADAVVNQLSHYANDAEYAMARRTFKWLMQNPTWPTEWILLMPLMAWNDYLFTGSTALLEKYAGKLASHTLSELVDSTGLLTTRQEQTDVFLKKINRTEKIKDIVDWPAKTESDGFVMTDYNCVVNAYHYMAVMTMANICNAIGDTKQAKEYEVYCRNFRQTFNDAFFDKKRCLYVDGVGTDHASLHANMFALAFGLVDNEHVDGVADFVVSRGMACSVYGAQFLLEALYSAGRDAEALKLMTATGERSWAGMTEAGATITMEAWSDRLKPNQDWNHAWATAPANIIPFRLMGVRPLTAGFGNAEIKPMPGGLEEMECKVPTPNGAIRLTLKLDSNGTDMEVELPEGVYGDVFIPVLCKGRCVVYDNGYVVEDYSIEHGTSPTASVRYARLPQPVAGRHLLSVRSAATDHIVCIKEGAAAAGEPFCHAIDGKRLTTPHGGLVVRNGRVVAINNR